MSSSTVKYKARKGDTVEKIAIAIGIKPAEIIALNKELNSNSRLVPDKTYLLPHNPSNNSFGAVNDIIIEWNARKVEAAKDG